MFDVHVAALLTSRFSNYLASFKPSVLLYKMAGNEFPTEYDEIVLGTGLQESILAAALARIGHRVLHLDRNDYYSGDWASFHLNSLLEWVDKNKDDNRTEIVEQDEAQTNDSNSLLQEGETLMALPHNPRTAFNIEVKCYVKEGNLEEIHERPIVIPPRIPEPEAEGNYDNLPQEQPNSNREHNSTETEDDFTRGAEAPVCDTEQVKEQDDQSVSNVTAARQERKTCDEPPSSISEPIIGDNDSVAQGSASRTDEQENSASSIENKEQSEAKESADNQGQGSTNSGQGSSDSQSRETSGSQAGGNEGQGAVGGVGSGVSDIPARREWTWADIKRQWRRFNVDLAPKLMFCRGSMVELLVSSRISRYAEFKAVTRILTLIEGQLEQVPCSRADVFSSKYVGMLEKRMLMRLIEFCLNHQNLQDEYEAFKDRPFVDFLQHRRLTPTLQHFVIHSIAMVNADTPTEEALVSMQYFLRSLGRYGNTAFLWTLYGSGELPQCFCRMCAVFAGIYMLRSLPRGLIVDTDNSCKGIVDLEGRRLTCNHVVMEHSYVPPRASSINLGSVSRGVLITDRSLKPSEYDEVTLLTVPPPEGTTNPVRVIELNWASCASPKDLFLVHLTYKSVNGASDDLQYALNQLFQPLTEEEGDSKSEKPKVLWSLFFNQVDATGCEDAILAEGLPTNSLVTAGPGASVGFEQAVAQARRLFERICPGEEFLPPAPDPEDIIFEDQARDNPGEHQQVGFETPSLDNPNAEADLNPQGKTTEEESVSASHKDAPSDKEPEDQVAKEDDSGKEPPVSPASS